MPLPRRKTMILEGHRRAERQWQRKLQYALKQQSLLLYDLVFDRIFNRLYNQKSHEAYFVFVGDCLYIHLNIWFAGFGKRHAVYGVIYEQPIRQTDRSLYEMGEIQN